MLMMALKSTARKHHLVSKTKLWQGILVCRFQPSVMITVLINLFNL